MMQMMERTHNQDKCVKVSRQDEYFKRGYTFSAKESKNDTHFLARFCEVMTDTFALTPQKTQKFPPASGGAFLYFAAYACRSMKRLRQD